MLEAFFLFFYSRVFPHGRGEGDESVCKRMHVSACSCASPEWVPLKNKSPFFVNETSDLTEVQFIDTYHPRLIRQPSSIVFWE